MFGLPARAHAGGDPGERNSKFCSAHACVRACTIARRAGAWRRAAPAGEAIMRALRDAEQRAALVLGKHYIHAPSRFWSVCLMEHARKSEIVEPWVQSPLARCNHRPLLRARALSSPLLELPGNGPGERAVGTVPAALAHLCTLTAPRGRSGHALDSRPPTPDSRNPSRPEHPSTRRAMEMRERKNARARGFSAARPGRPPEHPASLDRWIARWIARRWSVDPEEGGLGGGNADACADDCEECAPSPRGICACLAAMSRRQRSGVVACTQYSGLGARGARRSYRSVVIERKEGSTSTGDRVSRNVAFWFST